MILMWQNPRKTLSKYLSFKLILMAIISIRVIFKDELYRNGWWGIEGYGVGMVYWLFMVWFVLIFYWGHLATFEGERELLSELNPLLKQVSGMKFKGALIGTLSLALFDCGCDGLTEKWLKTPSLAQVELLNEARFYRVDQINVRGMWHEEYAYTSKGKVRRRYGRVKAVTRVTNGETEAFRTYLTYTEQMRIKGSAHVEGEYLERLYVDAKDRLFGEPIVEQCVRPLNRFDRKRFASLLPAEAPSKTSRLFRLDEAEYCTPSYDWLYLPVGLALFGYELWLAWALLKVREEETHKILSAERGETRSH